jgi:hypothetical protein
MGGVIDSMRKFQLYFFLILFFLFPCSAIAGSTGGFAASSAAIFPKSSSLPVAGAVSDSSKGTLASSSTESAGTAISESNLGTFPSPSSFSTGSSVSDSATANLNSSSTQAAGTGISETNLGILPSPSSFAAGSAVSNSSSGNLNSSSTQSVASAVSEESAGEFLSSSSFPAASSTSNSNLGNLLSPCSFPVAGESSPSSLGAFLGGLSFAGCGRVGSLGPELVTNGGMEDGNPPTGWTLYGNGSHAQSSAQAHGGTYSDLVTMSTPDVTDGGIEKWFYGLTIGKNYRATAWVRGEDLIDSSFRLEFPGSNNVPVSNGNWVQLEYSVEATTTSVRLRICVMSSDSNIGKKFYIDDASIREISVDNRADLFSSSNYSMALALSESESATFISAFNLQIGAFSAGSTGNAIVEVLTFSTEGVVANTSLANLLSSFSFLGSAGSPMSSQGQFSDTETMEASNAISGTSLADLFSAFTFQMGAASTGGTNNAFADTLTFLTEGATSPVSLSALLNSLSFTAGNGISGTNLADLFSSSDYSVASDLSESENMVLASAFIFQIGAISTETTSNIFPNTVSFPIASAIVQEPPGSFFNVAYIFLGYAQAQGGQTSPSGGFDAIAQGIFNPPMTVPVGSIFSNATIANQLLALSFLAISPFGVYSGEYPVSIALSASNAISQESLGTFPFSLVFLVGDLISGLPPLDQVYHILSQISVGNGLTSNPTLAFSSGNAITPASLGAFPSSIAMSGSGQASGASSGIYILALNFPSAGAEEGVSRATFPSSVSYPVGNSFSGSNLINAVSPLAFSSGGAMSPTNLGAFLSSIGISGSGGYSGTLAGIYTLALSFLAAGTEQGIHTAILPSSLSYLTGNSFSGNSLGSLSSPLAFSVGNGISFGGLGNLLASLNLSAFGAMLAEQGLNTYALALALSAFNQISGSGPVNFVSPMIFSAANSFFGNNLANLSSPVGFPVLSDAGLTNFGIFPASLNLPTGGTGEGIARATFPSFASYSSGNSFSGNTLANLSSPVAFSVGNGISPASLGTLLASLNLSAFGAALAQQGISTYILALALSTLNQISDSGAMNFPSPAIFSAGNSFLGSSLGNLSSPLGLSTSNNIESASLGIFGSSFGLSGLASFIANHGLYFLALDFLAGSVASILNVGHFDSALAFPISAGEVNYTLDTSNPATIRTLILPSIIRILVLFPESRILEVKP